MEFFLLERLKKEVEIEHDQYGGLKGSSTDHYLASAWTDIMTALDVDGRAVNLLSIDFAKAFNTMEHQACLSALVRKNASPHSIRMTASFLSDRQMRFKAGNATSSLRQLKGGAPQGTLMGNFLFITATDGLGKASTSTPLTDTPSRLEDRQLCMGTFNSVDTTPDMITPRKEHRLVPLQDERCFSTPTVRGQFASFSPESPTDEGDSFVHFNPLRKPVWRIDDTMPSFSDITAGNEEIRLGRHRLRDSEEFDLNTYKYVDDFLSCEELLLEDGFKIVRQGKQHINILAAECQSFFELIRKNAASVGMKVNEKKTQLLCLTATVNSTVSSYIRLESGQKISSQGTLKQLGFHFSKRPCAKEHVRQTALKFRKRLWFLRHLKKAGVSHDDLVLHVYRCFLLPIIDFSSPVYHSLLTLDQSSTLERLQSSALKTIFGWHKPYSQLVSDLKIETVSERRQRLTDNFILKTAENPRYSERWFPLKPRSEHFLRSEKPYEEKFARTNRLYNAPIYYYRRRLNELRDNF